jgi:hypothetical protein
MSATRPTATAVRPATSDIPRPPSKGFTKSENYLLTMDLSPIAYKLRAHVLPLWQYRYGARKPSIDILAAWCRCSTSTLVTARQELVDARLLALTKGGGFKQRTAYKLLTPPGAQEPGPTPSATDGVTDRNSASRRRVTLRNSESRPGSYSPKFGRVLKEEGETRDQRQKTTTASERGTSLLGASSSKAPVQALRLPRRSPGVPPPGGAAAPAPAPTPGAPAPPGADGATVDAGRPGARGPIAEMVYRAMQRAQGKDYDADDPESTDGLPSPTLMWSRVRTNRTALNKREREWVDGQDDYRKRGRREWSPKELTMLKNIYSQRIRAPKEGRA